MIYFYATGQHCWPLREFIEQWAPSLATKVQPAPYDALALDRAIPAGVHLFSDLERLLPPETAFARRLYDRLAAHPDSYQILNNPRTYSGRLGLLRKLAAAGINDFRAYRLNEIGPHVRFPVFLRWENDHSGSLGDPVHSIEQLKQQIKLRVNWRRKPLSHYLIAVEYIDARGEDGLFRKYSAINLGGQLIPRHVLFSDDWVTKNADIVNAETLREEQRFIEDFPHASELRRVFQLAGLQYGRIDYGISKGRIQVWEINTNPVIVPPPGRIAAQRRALQSASAHAIIRAFEQMAAQVPAAPGQPLFGRAEQFLWRGQARLSKLYNRYRP